MNERKNSKSDDDAKADFAVQLAAIGEEFLVGFGEVVDLEDEPSSPAPPSAQIE